MDGHQGAVCVYIHCLLHTPWQALRCCHTAPRQQTGAQIWYVVCPQTYMQVSPDTGRPWSSSRWAQQDPGPWISGAAAPPKLSTSRYLSKRSFSVSGRVVHKSPNWESLMFMNFSGSANPSAEGQCGRWRGHQKTIASFLDSNNGYKITEKNSKTLPELSHLQNHHYFHTIKPVLCESITWKWACSWPGPLNPQ